jgi:N-acetylneuraminic acid mutarotase
MMKRRFLAILTIAASVLCGVASASAAEASTTAPAQAEATGQWQFTGSLATGHGNWWNTGFTRLPDGRVLAISGSPGPGALTAAAEIYDPGTGKWTPAGSLNAARYAFGPPSVLPDGYVLVAGGHDINVNDYATAELYDPATNQWTSTGSLNTSRRYPVQVELANGQVLVATGSQGPPTCTRYLTSAELYNPATGQWTSTGSTLVPRESANAIRLADGRVLLAGGYNGGGGACTDTDPVDTEIYDPSTGQWSSAGNLPHGWEGGAMVLLPDHRVLMVDGNQTHSGPFAEAVIFDPATSQWSEAAAPNLPRSGAAATLLPDGKVLVSQGGQLQSEIYDPAANTWSLDATALDTNNGGHTFMLPNGKVLLVGGSNSTGPSTTAELYTPASSQGGTYVALGDSYAAGVGSGGTSSGGTCLRNSNAYPALWSTSHSAYQTTSAACSGATAGTVQSTQLQAITAGTTLITVTAGGDPGFVPLMASCSVPTPRGDLVCSAAALVAQAAINKVIEPNLESLYAAIRARSASVGDSTARLIVLGYPDFFAGNLLCVTSDSSEQAAINKTINVLDTAIAKAASATTGTTYVDVRPAFAAHELCSQTPWLNGLILSNPVTSFHPNHAGQAQGYETALTAVTG